MIWTSFPFLFEPGKRRRFATANWERPLPIRLWLLMASGPFRLGSISACQGNYRLTSSKNLDLNSPFNQVREDSSPVNRFLIDCFVRNFLFKILCSRCFEWIICDIFCAMPFIIQPIIVFHRFPFLWNTMTSWDKILDWFQFFLNVDLNSN